MAKLARPGQRRGFVPESEGSVSTRAWESFGLGVKTKDCPLGRSVLIYSYSARSESEQNIKWGKTYSQKCLSVLEMKEKNLKQNHVYTNWKYFVFCFKVKSGLFYYNS